MNIVLKVLLFFIFLGLGYGYNYFINRDVEFNNLGVKFYEQAKYEDAISQYDKALELKPKESLYNYNKGVALFYLKDYNRALVSFDNAIKYENKKENIILSDNYSKRGATYYELFKDKEALEDIDKALSLDSNNLWGLYYKTMLTASNKNYTGALSYIDKYINLDKTNPDAYSIKGDILYYIGETEKSNSSYLKSLELNNNSYLVNFSVATNYFMLSDYKSALKYYKNALKIEPNNYLNSFYVGYTLYKLGEFDDALKYFDKSYLLEGGKNDHLVKMYKLYLLDKLNNKKELGLFLDDNYKGINIADIKGLLEIFEKKGYLEFKEALEIYKLK
ncbi:hypothetical protein CSB07_00390 [Candidatus Gracilibacteria bacterium]|nr:MAG: hypothetical protein CSB07_00390 [Candidatus Gracilibacteria bacterium]PIE85118.1 MAG: hypothetical protein CSA08_03675 [Candidatus Gracilibacteria bacterium]